MNDVRDFWDKQAATFGTSDKATAPDFFIANMKSHV